MNPSTLPSSFERDVHNKAEEGDGNFELASDFWFALCCPHPCSWSATIIDAVTALSFGSSYWNVHAQGCGPRKEQGKFPSPIEKVRKFYVSEQQAILISAAVATIGALSGAHLGLLASFQSARENGDHHQQQQHPKETQEEQREQQEEGVMPQ
eukprot:jgi/Bigna1/132058/aug1.16_g6766